MPEHVGGFNIGITLKGTTTGQETVNVFYYHGLTFGETPLAIMTEFQTQVVDYLLTFMNQNAGFTEIVLQEIGGGGAFGSMPLSVVGAGGGDMCPPSIAFDFTYVRGAALERNGYKRIAGVGEGSQVNGVPTAGVLAVINAGVNNLFDPLSFTIDIWKPCIRRDTINRVPQVHPRFFTTSSVVFSKIGTQNSRKFGHGR